MENPTIIFCLPGNNFSGRFLESFFSVIDYCYKSNIKFFISRKESSVVYFVRNMVLGGDIRRGENQKPFNGKLKYTHLMWIDSDIIFSVAQFQALLKHDKNIVSGIYKMEKNTQYAVVENWDLAYLKQHGTFQFLTDETMKKESPFKVVYTGFGFMLIKYGVLESLNYPWFEPLFIKHEDMIDFCSEDVSFCKKVKDKGFDIWVDPAIKVGHEKKIVL